MKFVRLAPKALLLVPATVFLVATCPAQDLGPGVTAPPVRLTVKPGISTPIYIQTLTYAACALQADGLTDAAHTLKLYADQQGTIHFSFRPPFSFSSDVQQFLLHCQAGDSNTVTTYPIELRASYDPTTDFPFPSGRPPITGTIRPALTGDPMKPSQEDLVKAGYPLRPDAVQAPDAYAAWLRVVSRPATRVSTKSVSRPDRRARTSSASLNWSGYVVPAPSPAGVPLGSNKLAFVTGTWSIPSVTAPFLLGIFPYPRLAFNGDATSAFWVGLDGTCGVNCDLVQDGTEQDVVQWEMNGGVYQAASYYSWWALLPAYESEWHVQDFMPNAGDTMFVQAWIANALYYGQPEQPIPASELAGGYWTPDPAGNTAMFLLEDDSIGFSTYTLMAVPLISSLPGVLPVTFQGQTAEWIMERPTDSTLGLLGYLADYSQALMEAPYAQTGSGTFVHWSAPNDIFYTMFGCQGPPSTWTYNPPCNSSNVVLSSPDMNFNQLSILFTFLSSH